MKRANRLVKLLLVATVAAVTFTLIQCAIGTVVLAQHEQVQGK